MQVVKAGLQAALEDALSRHTVAGATVAVFHAGELVTACAGVINVNTGVTVTPDTLTHIGSITKVFTTTLVMQLVDEGLVELDDRLLRYLPDFRLQDHRALEQITVKMLLNHTSGINGEMLPDQGHDEETIEKGIGRFAALGQIHTPGTELSYCNAGMVIAGYLVQRLTGQSWYKLVRERILEPLGMKHSATLPEEALLHRASVGHYLNPTSRQLIRTSFAFLPLSFSPCGTSLMTSPEDLITFARAHMALGEGPRGTRILSERSARAMQEITVSNAGKGYTYTDMGLGWMVSSDGLLHHIGGSPGIVSALYVYPQYGFAAAILTNSAHGFSVINELVAPWLAAFGSMKPFGVVDIQRPARPIEIEARKYVGVYEDLLNRYRISQTSSGLSLSRQAKYRYYENVPLKETSLMPLLALGNDRFFLEPDGPDDGSTPDAFRIYEFRNTDGAGCMKYLGNSLRLCPRVS